MLAILDQPDRPSYAPGPHPRSRRLGQAFTGMGVAMIPWLFYLSVSLPASHTATHWCVAWVGLDSCEALALVGTGRLLLRNDNRCALTAVATSVLLSVDAWFDLSTAAPGADLATAIAMAALVEIPLAVLCAALALRVFRTVYPA